MYFLHPETHFEFFFIAYINVEMNIFSIYDQLTLSLKIHSHYLNEWIHILWGIIDLLRPLAVVVIPAAGELVCNCHQGSVRCQKIVKLTAGVGAAQAAELAFISLIHLDEQPGVSKQQPEAEVCIELNVRTRLKRRHGWTKLRRKVNLTTVYLEGGKISR